MSWPTCPGATTSPTPSSSTRCTRTWARPGGPAPTGRWPRPWRSSAATSREPGGRAGPPLVQRHPAHRPHQGDRVSQTGRRCRPGRPGPDDALRYYAQALDLCARADDVDATEVLDLAIGLGIAQRGPVTSRIPRRAAEPRAAEPSTWTTRTDWWPGPRQRPAAGPRSSAGRPREKLSMLERRGIDSVLTGSSGRWSGHDLPRS